MQGPGVSQEVALDTELLRTEATLKWLHPGVFPHMVMHVVLGGRRVAAVSALVHLQKRRRGSGGLGRVRRWRRGHEEDPVVVLLVTRVGSAIREGPGCRYHVKGRLELPVRWLESRVRERWLRGK